MLSLDYAKELNNGYVLSFFADDIADIDEISNGKEYITRFGMNYGVPLPSSTIVISSPKNGNKTYVLNDAGEWVEGGGGGSINNKLDKPSGNPDSPSFVEVGTTGAVSYVAVDEFATIDALSGITDTANNALSLAQTNEKDIGSLDGEVAELSVDVEDINNKIPAQASAINKLVDKEYVDSSISTMSATFRGSFATKAALDEWQEANPGVADKNDYAVVEADETHGNATWRYSFDTEWAPQYKVNNTPFTTAQNAAINSGITENAVNEFNSHVANKENPHGVTAAQVGLGNVDNTSDLDKPVSNAQKEALNVKLDKVSEVAEASVYGVSANKDQEMYPMSATPNVGHIAIYGENGVLEATAGTSDNSVVNKKQLEDGISNAVANLQTVDNMVASLTETPTAEQYPNAQAVIAYVGQQVSDVVPFIHITDVPEDATTGILTSDQLAVLEGNDRAYIMFSHRKYTLSANGLVSGYRTYTYEGYENGAHWLRSITITISTRSWVLNSTEIAEPKTYKHNIIISNSSADCLEFVYYSSSDVLMTKETFIPTDPDHRWLDISARRQTSDSNNGIICHLGELRSTGIDYIRYDGTLETLTFSSDTTIIDEVIAL